jgi:5-methylcytosine-specific restriction endonuclease McrA
MDSVQHLTRTCPKCESTLPLEAFGKDKHTPDGLTCWCIVCRRRSVRRWAAANPDRGLATKRKWRLRHKARINAVRVRQRAADPEKIRKQERERYWKNPETYRAKKRSWDRRHPEWRRSYQRRRYRERPEIVKAWVKTYRARRRGAAGAFTYRDIARIKRLQRGRCAYCPRRLTRFHIDHIFPLVLGGSNFPRNLQLTCESCNTSKGGRDPLDYSRRMGRLL